MKIMHPEVSVIVPAFNESSSINELFERTERVFQQLGISFEIIFIDDGSSDDTSEKIKSLCKKYPYVVLIRHFRNHGKSVALMQGFTEARGDIVITMDADLQDQPEEIPNCISKLAEGYDLVGGWRENRMDPFRKRLLSHLFNRFVSCIFGYHFKDINCGFKAFSRQVAQRLELRGDLHRLIPLIACTYGFSVTEIPVVHAPRKHGSSKYRLFRHRGLLDVFAVAAVNATQLRPLHVFAETAFGFGLFAIVTFLVGWQVFLSSGGSKAQSWFLCGVLFYFSLCSAIASIILPFFGLHLEAVSAHHQGADWRARLVREKLLAEEILP